MSPTVLQLRQLRSSQPSRSSQAAYAQMDRMQAASRKASAQAGNGTLVPIDFILVRFDEAGRALLETRIEA